VLGARLAGDGIDGPRSQLAEVSAALAIATQSALSFISKMVPAACALKNTREGHSATLTHTS
jgi:hypothetical protein